MSGLALIYHRDGAPADPAALEAMMGALGHRGPDGADRLHHGNVALGHQHFWTTPESVGERQPLVDPEAGLEIMFDGRLDNRPELLAALGDAGAEERRASDAALILRAYKRWGTDCFERFLGPFAVVVHDGRRRLVVCARDALGDRTLFYHLGASVLVVASEETAVLAHPAVPRRLDEATLALYFAVMVPEDGATFYRDVRELLPAQVMAVDAEGIRVWRHWAFDGSKRLDYRRDAEYAEQFRALLAQSVTCRLRSVTKPTVLMSGGLDSTSVAALAAVQMEGQGHSGPLCTVSWVFDELEACDERPFMDEVIRRYGIEAWRFAADGYWPLRDAGTWPWAANRPDGNPYRRLIERAYARTREAGARVLLSGWFGDHHYTGAEAWLADLLSEGRWAEAAREMMGHVRRSGLRRVLSSATVRHAGRRALDTLPGGDRLHLTRQAHRVPWLTPHAAALLAGQQDSSQGTMAGRRPGQVARMLGAMAATGASGGAPDASQAGVELWYPYRDRRLVEFTLAVPGHQLYNAGRYKHVLRNAMTGLLPDEIRGRGQPTSLLPLYARGLVEREGATVRTLLGARDALWPRYVQGDWLDAAFPARVEAGIDGAETVVPWTCLAVELWRRGFGTEWPIAGLDGAVHQATR